YYYYTLTDAGIEYLREYLHLPSEIFPATFKKTARPSAPRRAGNDLGQLFYFQLSSAQIYQWERHGAH
ncbi:hypothetical protein BGZ81_004991, partial [Podila clonocystis]